MSADDDADVPSPRVPRGRGGRRRQEILDVAAAAFATRGYHGASLAEIADEVGISAPAILHHFRTKEGLLTALLHARDAEDADDGDGGPARASSRPQGLAYLDHLVETVARNVERPGITQLYAVLSAESVTDGHPAQQWFRDRYVGLRALVERALEEALERGEVPAGTDVEQSAAAIVAVMDGLQVQWLLDPDQVDMVAVTRRTIDALLAALVAPPAARP
ncbi:TetR family transcriptional regulator [Cellulosimicrobium cellulans]|uniref:TetR family transcriptional regulator n=1 Tax=Cellulosimicrobium cellulans TaxID=1710 RepID=A0A1Y0HV85_CELCE|nr:TetR/AcrR family transcriptional regulator [Cellulosimicrobium cellulans]ARU52061.1 TetR family transcriptional regulator [Cellulosimicrobium cellulans]